jgi:hypothetical protein
MCAGLLPPGVNPTAVKYHIIYHIIPYHMITLRFSFSNSVFFAQCLYVLHDSNDKQKLFSQTGLITCHYSRGTINLHEDLYASRQTWSGLKDEAYMCIWNKNCSTDYLCLFYFLKKERNTSYLNN